MNLSCHLSTTNDFLFQIAVVVIVCSLAWSRPRFHSSLIKAIENEQSKWSTTSERERKYTALFVSGEYYHVNCISIFSGKAPPSATFTIPCGFNFLTFVQESFQGVRDREECLHGRRRSGSTSSPANANLLTVNVSGMTASWVRWVACATGRALN